MEKYYVYVAYGTANEVLYIGKGCGDRYKHCNSGISSCRGLNKYYFENGEGSITVSKHYENLSHKEAVNLERELIKDLSPKFNIQFVQQPTLTSMEKLEQGKLKDFKTIAEIYHTAYQHKDEITMNKVFATCQEFAEIVKTIGIEEVKSTGFHKTKSKAKYKKVLGIQSIGASKSKACKNLKLKIGSFYTYSEVRDKIQECYDKLGLKAKAKATDVKQIFNVKRTTRNGVEGYLISDKI